MIRFKRSEYNSVLKADSVWLDRSDDTPVPLFFDNNDRLVMWSGKEDVPEVGDKVKCRVPTAYEGVVKEHFLECGWVGLKVLPYPQYHEALSEQHYGQLPREGEPWTVQDLVTNFGCDLTTVS